MGRDAMASSEPRAALVHRSRIIMISHNTVRGGPHMTRAASQSNQPSLEYKIPSQRLAMDVEDHRSAFESPFSINLSGGAIVGTCKQEFCGPVRQVQSWLAKGARSKKV